MTTNYGAVYRVAQLHEDTNDVYVWRSFEHTSFRPAIAQWLNQLTDMTDGGYSVNIVSRVVIVQYVNLPGFQTEPVVIRRPTT